MYNNNIQQFLRQSYLQKRNKPGNDRSPTEKTEMPRKEKKNEMQPCNHIQLAEFRLESHTISATILRVHVPRYILPTCTVENKIADFTKRNRGVVISTVSSSLYGGENVGRVRQLGTNMSRAFR